MRFGAPVYTVGMQGRDIAGTEESDAQGVVLCRHGLLLLANITDMPPSTGILRCGAYGW
jgi:hypothetical protein